VRWYSQLIASRPVLINALFTGCSSACPLLTRRLVQVKTLLGERFGKGIGFVSISVDPLADTPSSLKKFALEHGADHPGWRFLTGKPSDVQRVLERLGLWVESPEGHQTVLIAGNARTGRWAKLRPDGEAAALARQLGRFIDPV